MTTSISSDSAKQRVARVVLACGLYACLGGLITLLGWFANIPRLTDWEGAGISMMPNMAVAATCAGMALVLLSLDKRRVAAILGLLVGLIGGATLFEYISGISLGIDTLLIYRPWGQRGTLVPGRMGPPGATMLTIIGTAIVLAAFGRSSRRAAVVGAMLVISIAMLSIVGYLLGADLLYSVPHLTTIALQTATILLLLAIGLAASVPEAQPMKTLRESSAAAALVRRALPFVVLLPIAIGWLRLRGEEAGWFDTAFGTALLVLILIGLLTAVLGWSAAAVSAHEKALRASREELAQAARRKDEFLATLAHELRNPLAPISNMLEIMNRTNVSGELLEQARRTMSRQLRQLVRLVDDLLDVSRISMGRIELRKERTELAAIIQHAVEATAPAVEAARHQLTVTLPAQPTYLNADPARMSQVFSNLLHNACKYTRPDGTGRIQLSAERQAGEIVVTVRDNGIGIPAQMLSKVFEMFTQVDQSRERAQGGLGIGLSLAKSLLEMHGGSVQAHSAGADRGSEFIVRLPVLLASTERPPPEQVAGVTLPAAPRRILVVDDNRDAAASLAMLLKLTGNETHTAYDGVAAVNAAATLKPDVVLLDLGLPRLSGYEAARQIRHEPWGKTMLLVALTGWGQDEDRRKSAEAGFDGHIVKPVDHASLTRLLAELSVSGGAGQVADARSRGEKKQPRGYTL